MGIAFSWFTRTEVADEAHSSLDTPSSFAYDDPFELLDLPPELIEQIHFAREQLFSAEREIKETDIAVTPGLGNFRLVNRYIERATRRAFVEKYFAH